jgi:LPS-assembly protein
MVFGGFLQADTGFLAINRQLGAYDQRLATRVGWRREEVDPVGGLWNFRMQGDARAYNAGRQQLNPNYLTDANGQSAVGNFRAAADWRMPLVRDWGEWGQQTIEPRVQVVGGPNTGFQGRYPNEDSIDYEFTDATLFNLNRFNGRDRQEGGMRVDYALRQAWNFPNGGMIEALAGQSLRLHKDSTFAAGTGLEHRNSDYVGRLTVAPTSWFNVSTRARLDSQSGANNFNDFIASTSFRNVLGLDHLGLQGGYLYSPPLPYITPVRTRNEVLAGFSASTRTASGSNWRITVSARYDLDIDRPVMIQGSAGYEDECFILETSFIRRFSRNETTRQQYAGNNFILVRLAFKTLGQYGFRAL